MLTGKVWTLELASKELAEIETTWKATRKAHLKRQQGHRLLGHEKLEDATIERDIFAAAEADHKAHVKALTAVITLLGIEKAKEGGADKCE
ncbi:hypothetical protein M0R72_12625 [Candidatus Pacearchaeota archaeon]|jgi:hypothetical protein|nr:hypothetical protein [Candidatus Pacearchaeota archaeon]